MTIDLKFEWDEAKRRANLVKHDVNFSDVGLAFIDPDRISYPGRRDGRGEERNVVLGLVRHRIIHVVFTMRGDTIRLISARSAHAKERSLYDTGKHRKSAVH
jgi:uncharacterized DUF497 family protein